MASRDVLAKSPPTRSSGAPAAVGVGVSTGAAGGVEIVGFPQMLYTRSGDPNGLFVPILDAVREAYGMSQRLCSRGETVADATSLSGMHLTSALLRTSIFSLVAKGQSYEHFYSIDLAADTLFVRTRLFATVSRRTSLFRVEIMGKISAGGFAVRNPGHEAVIVQAEEEQLRELDFFSSKLARECLRAQIEQQRFGRMEETLGPQAGGEVRLILGPTGKVPAILRQKQGTTAWDITDGRNQEGVGTLPAEMEQHLNTLIAYLQGIFSQQS